MKVFLIIVLVQFILFIVGEFLLNSIKEYFEGENISSNTDVVRGLSKLLLNEVEFESYSLDKEAEKSVRKSAYKVLYTLFEVVRFLGLIPFLSIVLYMIEKLKED